MKKTSSPGTRSMTSVTAGRTLARGEIYVVDDTRISFPERPLSGVRPKARPVILIQNTESMNDPRCETVLVVPITTTLIGQTDLCLPLEPKNGVKEPSLAKAGLIQPILKEHLEYKVSTLTPEALEALEAQILVNIGVVMETGTYGEVREGGQGTATAPGQGEEAS